MTYNAEHALGLAYAAERAAELQQRDRETAERVEREDRRRRRKLLRNHPGRVQELALGRFDQTRRERGFNPAWRELNAYARGVQSMVMERRAEFEAARIAAADVLHRGLSDASVKRWAQRRAGECGAAMMHAETLAGRYAAGSDYAAGYGIDAPELREGSTDEQTAPAVARLACRKWWTRRARRQLDRDIEREEIDAGHVRRGAAHYVSHANMERGLAQAERNRQLLLSLEAVNELGESFTLADLIERSNANPHIRRCELMVRLKGCEAVADRMGWVGRFLTWTLPSKYHAHPSNMPADNPRWIAAGRPKPRQGQAQLRDLWAKARASLAKMHARYFGIRVAEPHADAAPHWHLLLFVAPEQADAVCDLLRRYAFSEDADEPGAAEHRFRVEVIDKAKGGATSYVAKYVSKMTTGTGLDAARSRDADGVQREVGAPFESAQRARRWASVHGIRQFQFFGTPAVGIWRECRRLDGPIPREFNHRPLTAKTWCAMESARAAADRSDYAAHVLALGGMCQPRESMRVGVWSEQLGTLGRYGDQNAPTPRGLAAVQALRVPVGRRRRRVRRIADGARVAVSCQVVRVYAVERVHVAEVVTRPHVWVIKQKSEGARAGGDGAPWTRVTNCNQHAAADPAAPADDPPQRPADAQWMRDFGTGKERAAARKAEITRSDPAAVAAALTKFDQRERAAIERAADRRKKPTHAGREVWHA